MAVEITEEFVWQSIPPRARDSHKSTFGSVLAVAGSAFYRGAALLAAEGALRTGAGIVTLASVEPVVSAAVTRLPECCLCPCKEGAQGGIAPENVPLLRRQKATVLLVGPGLGSTAQSAARAAETRTLVQQLLPGFAGAAVLDADGLNALQGCTEKLDVRRGRVTILTPHDGEFARLTDRTLREIASSERAELASRFACEHGCILVLKGHRTRIALPDGRMLVNTSGCSALSKGGSGDVLTGLIASLLCQGMGAAEAAVLGVWLHGRAGELLAQEMTAYCASPRELVTRGLGIAFRELLEA